MDNFLFTCPFCKKQFYVTKSMVGQNVPCSHCGASITIRKQTQTEQDHVLPLTLGILSLLVPCLDLPLAITGLAISLKQKYQTGIILSSIGLGLFFFQLLVGIFVGIAILTANL